MISTRRWRLPLNDHLSDALVRDAEISRHVDATQSWSAGGHRVESTDAPMDAPVEQLGVKGKARDADTITHGEE
jgi:hypothetical protein